jgi:hypothetical protein
MRTALKLKISLVLDFLGFYSYPKNPSADLHSIVGDVVAQ